jgi:hypothetical protein
MKTWAALLRSLKNEEKQKKYHGEKGLKEGYSFGATSLPEALSTGHNSVYIHTQWKQKREGVKLWKLKPVGESWKGKSQAGDPQTLSVPISN